MDKQIKNFTKTFVIQITFEMHYPDLIEFAISTIVGQPYKLQYCNKIVTYSIVLYCSIVTYIENAINIPHYSLLYMHNCCWGQILKIFLLEVTVVRT